MRTQVSQGVGKRFGPRSDIFRRSILVRSMANTCAAAYKQHGNFSDAGNEKRVMVGAAHHLQARDCEYLAGLSQRVYSSAARLCRGIGVENFLSYSNSSSFDGFFPDPVDCASH